MLKPEFSEEGSNSYQFEKEVYGLFIKYLREVAGSLAILYMLSMDDLNKMKPKCCIGVKF